MALPAEMVLHVMHYLNWKGLMTAGMVCRLWKEVASTGALWSVHVRSLGLIPRHDGREKRSISDGTSCESADIASIDPLEIFLTNMRDRAAIRRNKQGHILLSSAAKNHEAWGSWGILRTPVVINVVTIGYSGVGQATTRRELGRRARSRDSLHPSYPSTPNPTHFSVELSQGYYVMNVDVILHSISLENRAQVRLSFIEKALLKQTDVVIPIFAVAKDPAAELPFISYTRLVPGLLPYIRQQTPSDVPIVLAGNKADLRRSSTSACVEYAEVKAACVCLGLAGYVEYSALAGTHLQKLLDFAVQCALFRPAEPRRRGRGKDNSCGLQ